MADPLNREQQEFFQELVSFDIPDSIAVIIALKTNWGEIRRWDEHRELRLLASIIWKTGVIVTMADSMKMAQHIKRKGLDSIYKIDRPPRREVKQKSPVTD